jgi:hypothetical protein
MRCIATGLITTLCLFAGSRYANGVQVRFDYSGEVTAVQDPDDVLGGSVTVGTPFSGMWIYETTTPDYSPDPSAGMYNNAVSAWTLAMGGNNWQFAPPTEILVSNPATGWDSFEQDGAMQPAFGSIDSDLLFTLTDHDGSAMDSDALPTSLNVSEFEIRQLDLLYDFDAPTRTVYVGGTINSISSATVPEPSALALLGVAAGFLVYASRRRRR